MTETYTFQPAWASPPGDTIAAVLRERSMTQSDLAERTGYSKKHINDLVRGRAAITFEAALRLETVLGSTADFWMRRELLYREAIARSQVYAEHAESADWLKTLPLADMIRLGWIDRFHDKGQQVAECLRFFAVASVPAWQSTYSEMAGAFRSSPKATMSGAAASAWIRQGEILASKVESEPYNAPRLRQALASLRALTRSTDPNVFVPQLKQTASSFGVAVVFLPRPKQCPASGATKWLAPDKAMLLLSNRYKSHDTLWFTIFHEMCHILRHSKKITVIEGANNLDQHLESEADAFAADVLIPPEHAERLPSIGRSCAAIAAFAAEIGVAPDIVLGRMQKEKLLPWSHCSELRVRYELIPGNR